MSPRGQSRQNSPGSSRGPPPSYEAYTASTPAAPATGSTPATGREPSSTVEWESFARTRHTRYGTLPGPVTVAKPQAFSTKHLLLYATLFLVVPAIYLFYMNSLRLAILEDIDRDRRAHDSELEYWRLERLERQREFERWEAERKEWERERQKWDAERRAHEPFFEPPELASIYCMAYNTRRYRARLWNVPLGGDWLGACLNTRTRIHGREIGGPERCVDEGNGVLMGYWTVNFDEMECQSIWGRTWDKGCEAGGIHKIEAPLWGQKPNDDWYEMCRTTPGHLPGIDRDLGAPTRCEQRGQKGGGMIGIWELHDGSC